MNKNNKRENSKKHKNFEERQVSQIISAKPGDYFKGTVKVLRRTVPGPVILIVTDGSGMIEAVTKECKAETDDVIELNGKVEERAGKLQIEIDRIADSDKNFDSILEKEAEPKERPFSVKSERFDKMRPSMLRIAKRIRYAIFNSQPIMIRHHADADGIMSGMAIEQSIRELMESRNIDPSFSLYRSPSKAPFYEMKDVLRDISFTKKYLEGHGQKKPLILVLDNGSTPEDKLAMKSLKMLGFEIIVIDHHNPVEIENGKTSVCPYLLDHLNPYMFGLDGQTSAGMLCYEVARLIYKDFENPILPAISAIGDRCDIPQTEMYIKKSNKSEEEIRKMIIAIDFLAWQLRFDSGEGIYQEVFKTKEFVEVLNEEVNKGVETQLQSTMPYLRTQEINGVTFSHIDLEKYTLRFTYPTPGKVIGMIHDEIAIGKENMPVISIGYLSDMIILRATKPVLPIAQIIEKLQNDIPEANVDGGGHECAGTIKFVPAHLNAIIESIKSQIRNLDPANYME